MTISLLEASVDKFIDENLKIRTLFDSCRSHDHIQSDFLYAPTEEGCLFALWDAWSRFMRRLILQSCAGESVGLSGSIYTPVAPRNEREAISFLKSKKNGKMYKFTNEEPNWHGSVAVGDIVAVLDLPNASTIVGAVTATQVNLGPVTIQSPVEEIRIARNFCAHKNWKTQSDIAAYSSSFTSLTEHLRRPRRGVETFSEWSESLDAIASAAAD